jgi:hypothetical protein
MAQAVEPERGAGSVTFEVERFEPRGRDQLVLSGRWFGLRGRRFVRPTLTLGTGENRRRALADLEHKPWAAEDGELWEATFPVEPGGAKPRPIELSVAPDVTVMLPPPGAGAGEQRIRARPRRDDLLDNLRGARRDGRPQPGSRNGRDPRQVGRSATRREDGLEAQREAPRVPDTPSRAPQPREADPEADRTGRADPQTDRLSQAHAEIKRLRAELARHEGAEVEAAQALTRRDAAVNRMTEATAQRNEAAAAYEQAVSARDMALRERDRLAKERDRIAKERDRMAKDREHALRERDRAIAKADKAAEAAARVEHRAAATHPTVPGTKAMTSPWVVWTQRLLAVSVLVIVVLAVAITARVL